LGINNSSEVPDQHPIDGQMWQAVLKSYSCI
jgi:hypothetical protein